MLPQKITNEYGNTDGVTRAATEVIDGVEYEVVYLTGDHSANLNKITANNQNRNVNYRYVLTADWLIPGGVGNIRFYCKDQLILDLNGYRIQPPDGHYFGFHNGTVTITDSSVAQTGNLGWIALATFDACHTIILNGGTKRGTIDLHASAAVICQGGNYQLSILTYESANLISSTVAPWMYTWEDGGRLYAKAYAAYAVSTTPYAAGVYNYAYGYTWELNATQLSKLEIPDDKTYYLWGRDNDGWYQYLALHCTDGQNWTVA